MSTIQERILSLFSSIRSHPNRNLVPLVSATIGTGLLASFLSWCYRDYQSYLALGPGGPPYNVIGWAGITFCVRPFALRKSDATMVADYPEDGAHESIKQLHVRKGDRALLGGVAPHRQLSQNAPKEMKGYIQNLFNNAAKQHPELLEIKRSLYERHNDALFVSAALLRSQGTSVPDTAKLARGEVGHVHPDLSVHLYLSPADARQAIKKGWAERHRLSVPKSFWLSGRFSVGDTFLMIYGPRDEGEMEILKVVLENSIRFMTGREEIEELEWRKAL